MGFIRQSFKRQIFFIFLAVTLAMVIIGGILTVQGFQASIKADYQKNDIEQDRILTQSLVSDLEMVSNAANSIAENEILLSAVAGKKGVSSLSVYSALYENTRDIKDLQQLNYIREASVYSARRADIHQTICRRAIRS